MLAVNKLRDAEMPGIIIVGRGDEQFALKRMGRGQVGVVDVNDKNGIMQILDLRTANTLIETGLGGVGLYYDNPLNEWYGAFFDRVPVWMESQTHPGLYWNTAGDPGFNLDVLYRHKVEEGFHIMEPTETPRY